MPSLVSLIVCEAVLTEKTDLLSAIRIMNALTVAPGNNLARFKVLTIANAEPGDFDQHTLSIRMTSLQGTSIASAPEHRFVFGNKLDPGGPLSFTLTTDFAVSLQPNDPLGAYMIWAFLDGRCVVGTPLTLRRGIPA